MKPVVIMDGCRSHNREFLDQHGISTVIIPPHSSHIFQACDASIFSSIKKEYVEELNKCDSKESMEFPNLSRVSASFISLVKAVKTRITNSNLIKGSFKRV